MARSPEASLLRQGFGRACLGHLDDLHRDDAFASYAVPSVQLVERSLCHASQYYPAHAPSSCSEPASDWPALPVIEA